MLLSCGIGLWALVHLFGALLPGRRAGLVARMGIWPYKGVVALLLTAALVLIVLGWQAMAATPLYALPMGLRHLTMALMPLAVILFVSSNLPTDIKQFIRHPQLAAVKLWAVAHLLANADARSWILFGGLLAWAVLEVIFINRREGAWQKPARVGWGKTLLSAFIGLLLTAVLVYSHVWFTGMPLLAHG